MKKIIPFKKEILFNTNVSEITSISLEQSLKVQENNLISGDFLISGEYKMSDSSINTETFDFELPCDINLDSRYKLDNVQIDIDDFYYELINSNILQVNIDVVLDKLEEKEEEKVILNEIEIKRSTLEDLESELLREENNMDSQLDSVIEQNMEDRCIEEEEIPATSVFNNFSNDIETYKTYKVYIVREGDSLEMIIQKYGITKEMLEQYNDIKEINLGDKLIIPDFLDEKN